MFVGLLAIVFPYFRCQLTQGRYKLSRISDALDGIYDELEQFRQGHHKLSLISDDVDHKILDD